MSSAEVADVETRARSTIAQVLGGILVIFGVYYGAKRVLVMQEGASTDSLSRAIDQLGHENPAVRMGGAYALERLASVSDELQRAVCDILAAYILSSTSSNGSDDGDETEEVRPIVRTPDVQAALTILGRCRVIQSSLKLWFANLAGYVFSGNFSYANFYEADFSDAECLGIDLTHCHMTGSCLERAVLRNANFREAKLYRAQLSYANLSGADLRKADLDSALLVGALLVACDFRGADLTDVDLSNADLEDANLRGVDLSSCHGLTDLQVASAKTNAKTVLPELKETKSNGEVRGTDDGLTSIPGVGSRRAEVLRNGGVETVEDVATPYSKSNVFLKKPVF